MKKIKRGEVVRAVHRLDDLDICTEIKKGDVENITLSMIEDCTPTSTYNQSLLITLPHIAYKQT